MLDFYISTNEANCSNCRLMQEFKNMLKIQTPPQLDSITGPTPTPHIVQATWYTAQSRVKLIFMANIIDLFLVLCQTLFCIFIAVKRPLATGRFWPRHVRHPASKSTSAIEKRSRQQPTQIWHSGCLFWTLICRIKLIRFGWPLSPSKGKVPPS